MNKKFMGFAVAGVAVLMLGAAFASKSVYDTFCKVTGFGGTTQVATERPDEVLDRMVRVRFDANAPGLPFKFHPTKPYVDVKVGDTEIATFEVTNLSDEPIMAVAGYNVTPYKAGEYFTKLECFCFDEQLYEPGETVTLPVMFFVNPMMDDERQMDDVKAITLSYTYYEAKGGNESLASLRDLVSEGQ